MQKTFNTLLTIFIAFVFSSLVYLLIGFFLSRSPWNPAVTSGTIQYALFAILLVISMLLAFLVGKLKRSFFSEEMPRPENLEQLQRYIVSHFVMLFALSEIPAILGLVFFMLSASFSRLLILCLVSLISFTDARPSQKNLEDLQRRYSF